MHALLNAHRQPIDPAVCTLKNAEKRGRLCQYKACNQHENMVKYYLLILKRMIHEEVNCFAEH